MTTTLKFNAMDVCALINHSDKSPEWRSAFYDDGPAVSCIMFVKDDGIYLMSGGVPRQEDGTPVVYAKGYDPKTGDVWDKCRDAVGGDDFAEYFPTSDLTPIPENAEQFFIKVSPKTMECGWILGRNPTRAKVKA